MAICNEIEVGIGLHLLRRFGEASIAAKYHFLCRVDECLRERRPMIGAVTSAGGSRYMDFCEDTECLFDEFAITPA